MIDEWNKYPAAMGVKKFVEHCKVMQASQQDPCADGHCTYAEDVDMPEHHCAPGHCIYKELLK